MAGEGFHSRLLRARAAAAVTAVLAGDGDANLSHAPSISNLGYPPPTALRAPKTARPPSVITVVLSVRPARLADSSAAGA